ncbi:FAD/NAD(P)-binding oxidoreductase [Labrys okinawensis]|uniref:FAD/NAD(P)-binding oxidoreductase n=1 Tax=Labrys okinawensis TaxID=346911 RepID=A0A2S9QH80_9HYPH|nr:NAD(P)/FAD-dependent oxidoreductase [Labrys okinawensis]PRH88640.1 FAD/NAD(P)-binding oxidoreductase [Labrys okinawensis]
MVSDVAIIGAGVVGCAIARRFALEGLAVTLIEAGGDILSGASKANSAILHTGFDAPPGSLEHACIRDGYAEYREIHQALGLPLLRSGALVVAWDESEEAGLEGIRAKALENGIDNVAVIGRAELHAREPGLSESARAALFVPDEALIDPWSPFLAYVEQAMAHGATVLRGTRVTGGQFNGLLWRLETTAGPVEASSVINCAGNHGDEIDKALLGHSAFEIRPRKGQFVVFDKAAYRLASAIILPVPNERTKGVVVTRTVFGNLLVGPTAEEQQERDRADVDRGALEALIRRGIEILPALAGMPVTACYAGLRPATEKKDYRIDAYAERNWISVGGIRSTGLSASLGIARHVLRLYQEAGGTIAPVPPASASPVPNLAEHLPRDYGRPGYGEIICHCELVTKREIEVALSRPLAARDFGGLKRRTRCAMGRCQGFNCSARLASLTQGRFAVPLDSGAAR